MGRKLKSYIVRFFGKFINIGFKTFIDMVLLGQFVEAVMIAGLKPSLGAFSTTNLTTGRPQSFA